MTQEPLPDAPQGAAPETGAERASATGPEPASATGPEIDSPVSGSGLGLPAAAATGAGPVGAGTGAGGPDCWGPGVDLWSAPLGPPDALSDPWRGPRSSRGMPADPWSRPPRGTPADPWSRPPGGMPADPWSRQAWGTRSGREAHTGQPGQPGARHGLLVTLALIVAVVLAGGVGAAIGVTVTQHELAVENVFDPSAVLGESNSTAAAQAGAGLPIPVIAERLIPSVVTINVDNPDGSADTGAGVILSSNGYIVTNNHVVAGGAQPGGSITVNFANGRRQVPAEVVGRDPLTDLAVIKVALTGLRPAVLGNSASLQVGDEVVAIGAPLGFSGTVTSGIVSALDRTVSVPATTYTPPVVYGGVVQTDAPINPGNSGGALVNDDGQVVGINSAIASLGSSSSTQTGSIGIGFAIPVDTVRQIAEELIRHGYASHPYIGFVPQTVTPDQAAANGLVPGVYVYQVEPGSPAARDGLAVGDVVTALNGTKVTSSDQLILLERTYVVGQRISITYWRSGAYHTLHLTLVESPQAAAPGR